MNVRINASGYDDKTFVEDILAKGKDIETKTIVLEEEILKIVNEKIGV
jgi:glutamate formiminotransferase/formiminotetrahydrofolate cyclodeaminase